jgi:hypothetical protein
LDNLTPGAQVEVFKESPTGSESLGKATSYNGEAVVGVSPKINLNDKVYAVQSAPRHRPGPPVYSLPAERPVPAGEMKLPAPIIEAPVECDITVVVGDVFDGALITIRREINGQTTDSAGCFWGGRRLVLLNDPPLRPGESLTVKQEFQKQCEGLDSPWLDPPVIVKSAEALKAPIVWGPICAGATSARISSLHPGAILTVKVEIVGDDPSQPDGTIIELGSVQVPESGWFDVPLPTLPPGKGRLLFASQEFCEQTSPDSYKVPIADLPVDPQNPTLPGPLYACASVVRVTDIMPGAKVTVYSKRLGAPIAEKRVYAAETGIKVFPVLIAGDEIRVMQGGCSDETARSDVQVVKGLDDLPKPKVEEPIHPFTTMITVSDVVAGAQVHVWVNDQWRTTVDADDTKVSVPISGLEAEDRVTARQTLCAMVSDTSDPITVTLGAMTTEVQYDHVPVYGIERELVVTVQDKENNQPVEGEVIIDSIPICSTDEHFRYTFQPDTLLPHGIVRADGYEDAEITWKEPLRQMIVSVVPKSVQKGTQVTLTVSAHDMWTNTSVDGSVLITTYTHDGSWSASVVGRTFEPFSYAWPRDYVKSTGSISVKAQGYWGGDLKGPQLSAPAPQFGTLALNVLATIKDQSSVVVSNLRVEWDVTVLNTSRHAEGNPASVQLPVPADGGTVECEIDAKAYFNCEGEISERGDRFPAPKVADAKFRNPPHETVWDGSDQARTFSIDWDSINRNFFLGG